MDIVIAAVVLLSILCFITLWASVALAKRVDQLDETLELLERLRCKEKTKEE